MPRRAGLTAVLLVTGIAACFPDYSTGGSGTSGIAFVQGKADRFGPSATASIALDGDVVAHDALVVCLNYDGTTVTVSAIEDSLGNTFTTVVDAAFSSFREIIAVAPDARAGRDTVQVTLSGAPSTLLQVYLHEYSGIAATTPFDVGSSESGTVATAASDDMTSGKATTAADHELVFGFGVTTGSATAGSGFTPRETLDQNVTEDMILPARGAAQATATAAGGDWSMLMATFRGK